MQRLSSILDIEGAQWVENCSPFPVLVLARGWSASEQLRSGWSDRPSDARATTRRKQAHSCPLQVSYIALVPLHWCTLRAVEKELGEYGMWRRVGRSVTMLCMWGISWFNVCCKLYLECIIIHSSHPLHATLIHALIHTHMHIYTHAHTVRELVVVEYSAQ